MAELPVIYPGVHRLTLARHLERCMISANRLAERRADIEVNEWMMDSGAFTRISRGLDHLPTRCYADMIDRWAQCGNLVAAVAQDYMCEPFVLAIAGATVAEHQAKTTDRYCELRNMVSAVHVMPVIQGFSPEEYAAHARQMAQYVEPDAWVGVGSVCKRQGNPDSLAAVLEAVHAVAPDWRLHGFGVKATSLQSGRVASRLHSVDSMAWSFAARYSQLKTGVGPGANDLESCLQWLTEVESITPTKSVQTTLPLNR